MTHRIWGVIVLALLVASAGIARASNKGLTRQRQQKLENRVKELAKQVQIAYSASVTLVNQANATKADARKGAKLYLRALDRYRYGSQLAARLSRSDARQALAAGDPALAEKHRGLANLEQQAASDATTLLWDVRKRLSPVLSR
jgi:hypothetical protein